MQLLGLSWGCQVPKLNFTLTGHLDEANFEMPTDISVSDVILQKIYWDCYVNSGTQPFANYFTPLLVFPVLESFMISTSCCFITLTLNIIYDLITLSYFNITGMHV